MDAYIGEIRAFSGNYAPEGWHICDGAQLTIQGNAAAYNFAHKIYELQRTKVFSKIKIVHNYFE